MVVAGGRRSGRVVVGDVGGGGVAGLQTLLLGQELPETNDLLLIGQDGVWKQSGQDFEP